MHFINTISEVAAPADFRRLARKRLPPFLFEYIDGGANDEATLRRNAVALEQMTLHQRVMSGVDKPSLSATWFGQTQPLPLALAPVGLTGMFARRGELQAARAASARQIPFCLSTVSVCSLREVKQGSSAAVWFQLYLLRDRGFMRELLSLVKEQQCNALMLTVDMPVPGVRYRDRRSGMSGQYAAVRRYLQALRHPRWAIDVGLLGRPLTLGNVAPLLGQHTGLEDFMGWLAANFDPSLQWRDLEWVRQNWDGPLVIKGIMHPEDAKAAVRLGANAIVVSNHGGRQLDACSASVRVLPAIVDALDRQTLVLADSGVRSGVDVIRMLAAGAQGVLLGRAWIYALAAQGERGVRRLLDLIEHEMRVTMILTGTRSLAELASIQVRES
jgi:L-lactate dehydrogenase (cytochrome)